MKAKIAAILKYVEASKRRGALLIFVLVIIIGASFFLVKSSNLYGIKNNLASNVRNEISKPKISSPKATEQINKNFIFSVNDNNGKELGKITYTLESAELTNEIIIKGQRATAIAGREFLIINLKIKSEQSQEISINSRDYIRMQVQGTQDWIAPDIHNDPVTIQPISTKYTRVGFAVGENDTSFNLQIGEINKDKANLDLLFK